MFCNCMWECCVVGIMNVRVVLHVCVCVCVCVSASILCSCIRVLCTIYIVYEGVYWVLE